MEEGKFYSEEDLSQIAEPDRARRKAIETLWTNEKDDINRGYDSYTTLMTNGRIFEETGLDEWSFDGISSQEFDHMLSEGKILDVGCGQGQFVKDCLDYGYDAYGIDLALKHQGAVDKVKTTNPEVIGRIIAADGTVLPFKDGTFKTVLNIFGVPNYLYDPKMVDEVVNEQLRILDSTGRIIICPIIFRDNAPYPTNYVKKLSSDHPEEIDDRGQEVEHAFAGALLDLEKSGRISIERHVDRDRINEPGHANGSGYIIIEKIVDNTK